MAAFSSAGQVRRRPAPVNTSRRRARSGTCISSEIDIARSSKPAPNVTAHARRWKMQPRRRLRLNELEQRIEERTREREHALAQLFEAQKLDTIGQLTGGMAHDFNNLLMAVLGSLQLLKKRLPDDPRAQRLLNNAMLGADRGAALTQRLLS